MILDCLDPNFKCNRLLIPTLPYFKPELSLLFVDLLINLPLFDSFAARVVIVVGCVSAPVGLVSPIQP
jgi:hypothetical protein